jgi:hypothetical protein
MVTKKRGRPSKNGKKDPKFLARSMVVLAYFEEARKRGEKYETALAEVVERMSPGKWGQISQTEVKRVLAQFQSRDAEEVFTAEVEPMTEEDIALHEEIVDFCATVMLPNFVQPPSVERMRQMKKLMLKIRPNSRYPRTNRKTKTDTSAGGDH